MSSTFAGADRDQLTIDPLTGTFGAEVRGVDLAAIAYEGGEAVEHLRWLLHEHALLVFRDQRLDDESHPALAERFGPIYRHSFSADGDPTVTVLDSGDSKTFGTTFSRDLSRDWHTDAPWDENPPYLAILRGVQLPAKGGDTLWIDTRAAYDGLSEPMRAFLATLNGINDPGMMLRQASLTEAKDLPISRHPAVVVDPLTSRRSFYISPLYTTGFEGLSPAENRALLDLVFDHMMSPAYQVRFRWTPGSVVMWHERMTLHVGVSDYAERRVLRRIIVGGPAPVPASTAL